MTRLLSAALAFAPFAFGMIRAIQTDARDLRYLWVAFAAFAGAMARMVLARRQRTPLPRLALAAGIFVTSSLFAALAAWALGTTIGPAMLVVSAAFGFCFAASTFIRMPVR
jgi:hypothetical protein